MQVENVIVNRRRAKLHANSRRVVRIRQRRPRRTLCEIGDESHRSRSEEEEGEFCDDGRREEVDGDEENMRCVCGNDFAELESG